MQSIKNISGFIQTIIVILFIGPSPALFSQCDFYQSISVSTSGFLSSNTQEFVLVEDNSGSPGNILAINSSGTFLGLTAGDYWVYAVNYEGTQATELAVNSPWSGVLAYDGIPSNCFDASAAFNGNEVTVCDAEQICEPSNINTSTTGYNMSPGFSQTYVLVNGSSGLILAFNSSGTFTSAAYVMEGLFYIYAVNTEVSEVTDAIIVGDPFSNVTAVVSTKCADILNPFIIEVIDEDDVLCNTCVDRDFTYAPNGGISIASSYCVEAPWTHYYDPLNPEDLLFSIKKNGNDFTATILLHVMNTGEKYLASASNTIYSTQIMRRAWEVIATGPDYNDISGTLSASVDIRFYYPVSEKNELRSVTNDFLNGTDLTGVNPNDYNHQSIEPFAWFKSIDGTPFDPNLMVTAEAIIGEYALTVTGEDITTTNGTNYVEFSNVTGFSGGSLADGTAPEVGSPLPVEWLSFKGEAVGAENHLFWQTATEINSDIYEINSSIDGINFSKIGEIAAAGNSSTELNYTFVDENPYEKTSYYQLKQIDFDGSFMHSNIISISRVPSDDFVSIYPNPVQDQLHIDLVATSNKAITLVIYDMLGKKILDNTYSVVLGYNDLQLDIDFLAAGLYQLVMTNENKKNTLKFTKVK